MPPRVTNAQLAERLDEIIEELREMNHRQRDDHDEITKLKERQGIVAMVNAGWSVLVAAFAGWFGAQR